MRLEGTIRTWNDERGFGFITPAQGGPDVFVHIKALGRGAERPQVGAKVSFEVETGADGKKRALRVLPQQVRPGARKAKPKPEAPRRKGAVSYLAIPLFIALYIAMAIIGRVPVWVAGLYGAASLLTFIVYAIDKSAAAKGHQRVSENTLLCLGTLCGWPGAILAQQWLRHKSSKASFLVPFWFTVCINAGAFAYLTSPMAPQLFR